MKHLQENNETYLSHFKFAFTIGATLIFRGTIFLFHLEATCKKLKDWNNYTEQRKL
jgi:ABC-type uncharacterized transport system YnjBCD permease subunit